MKCGTNLLSTEAQKRQMLRQFLRKWCAAWIACLAIGGIVSAHQWRVVRAESEGFAEVSEQHEQVQREMQRGDVLQARIKALEAERDRYASIANTNVPLSLLGLLAQTTQAADSDLRLNTLSMREVSIPAQKGRPAIRRMTLDMEGTAQSDQAVGRFVRALHNSGVFESVDLKSSRGTATGQITSRQFRLQCVLPSPEFVSPTNVIEREKI